MPLASIRELLDGTSTRVAVVNNLVGNLLLFAPLAVLLRGLLVRSSWRTLLVVAVGSGLVEVVQGLGWPDGRQANIDDVLLNVLGAAVALALLAIVRPARPTSTRPLGNT